MNNNISSDFTSSFYLLIYSFINSHQRLVTSQFKCFLFICHNCPIHTGIMSYIQIYNYFLKSNLYLILILNKSFRCSFQRKHMTSTIRVLTSSFSVHHVSLFSQSAERGLTQPLFFHF